MEVCDTYWRDCGPVEGLLDVSAAACGKSKVRGDMALIGDLRQRDAQSAENGKRKKVLAGRVGYVDAFGL